MGKSNFDRLNNASELHFTRAAFGQVQRSRMKLSPLHLTTFNAGDIVPVFCKEVLPDDEIEISSDFVIRQSTLLTPTMGTMTVDLYAFFVPNRIVNDSWKAVMGENYSGSWTADSVRLAPLYTGTSSVQVPVGSVADYYGFPTQLPIPASVLNQCHDLKFRGYVMIYNEFFRDQNYQPPIPITYLNVYQGFFDARNLRLALTASTTSSTSPIPASQVPNGSFGPGAVAYALQGAEDSGASSAVATVSLSPRFNALAAPLKANKLHDYFTSVLPSPSRGGEVFAPVSGSLTIPATRVTTTSSDYVTGNQPALLFGSSGGTFAASTTYAPFFVSQTNTSSLSGSVQVRATDSGNPSAPVYNIFPANLSTFETQATVEGLALSVDDLRMSAAIQQIYEALARGGARYRSYIASFFGIEVDDPFSDIPSYLGHIRRDLDLFQTAQTSASVDGNTPQGNLAAFGYTNNGGMLFKRRFIEHGYIHVMAVVRHRNVYSSLLARDNFRLTMLDYYHPMLANVSEQPVFLREINPFASSSDSAFGYQEAFAEYRYEPDRVSGLMRPGVSGSLAIWNYADEFSSTIGAANGTFMKSNSQEVLDRSLAVNSSVAPQFKAQFVFHVDQARPMPIYSVPGLDIV